MEEQLPPADAEDNIFYQFDILLKGELSPEGGWEEEGYCCRLPPCHRNKRVFQNKRGITVHRRKIHLLPMAEKYKLPTLWQTTQWLRAGKPRPFENPQRPIKLRPLAQERPSLLFKLIHYKPDTEPELPPASLDSNIYEQFDVRALPGGNEGSATVGYFCMLSQCPDALVCWSAYERWTHHRTRVHMETEADQLSKLPNVYEIRKWVQLKKPRPYEVPVRSRLWKKYTTVDPDVFTEFDAEFIIVEGAVHDDGLKFHCLLQPCLKKKLSLLGRKSWRSHRFKQHNSPQYETGEYSLPSGEMILAWIEAGKPPHYKPQRWFPPNTEVDPSTETSTEFHNGEMDPTSSQVVSQTQGNVDNEVNVQKSQDLTILPGDMESTEWLSGNQNLQEHHPQLISQENHPSLRTRKGWARLGNSKQPTTPSEIPIARGSSLGGSRPRNADAADYSDTKAAHQKKKRRQSSHSPDSRDRDPNHDSIPAEMGEADGEEREGFVAPENAFPALSYLKPKLWEQSSELLQDFKGEIPDMLPNPTAEKVEVEEENPEHSATIEEFLSSLSCLSKKVGDIGIVECDYVQPQIIQGEVHEMLLNTGAEVAEVSEEIVDFGNLSPLVHLKSESSEQNAFETSALLHFIDALQFSSEDSPSETHNNSTNSTADMDEVTEEAPGGFVAPQNFMPSTPLMQIEGNVVLNPVIPINAQAAPIQEFAPVNMDPCFIYEPYAPVMADVAVETVEEFAALGNWLPLLPSNEQFHLSNLSPYADSQDPMNIQDYYPSFQENLGTAEFINTGYMDTNEPAVVPFAAPSQPGDMQTIQSIFMDGSTEYTRENLYDPVQDFATLMDVEIDFEHEPDIPIIDGGVEEFYLPEAMNHSPQPMQELSIPWNSENSNNLPFFPAQLNDTLMGMAPGFDYGMSDLSQPDEMPSWFINQ